MIEAITHSIWIHLSTNAGAAAAAASNSNDAIAGETVPRCNNALSCRQSP